MSQYKSPLVDTDPMNMITIKTTIKAVGVKGVVGEDVVDWIDIDLAGVDLIGVDLIGVDGLTCGGACRYRSQRP